MTATAPPAFFSARGQALLGGFEFALGGAPAGSYVTAAAERAAGVGGQVTGHPGQVVVIGAAEAHRPGQGRGGRFGQVAEEAQPGLFGGVLVVEFLDQVTAALDLGAQPRGFLAQRVGAVAAVDLDVQQGQARPAGRDPDRGGIQAGRQASDDHRPQPRFDVHRAGALDAGAVPEYGHGHDRRVQAGAFRHRLILPLYGPACGDETIPGL